MIQATHGVFNTPKNTALLLLDTYTGAAAAYSVSRKLRTAYNGAAYRVRRSIDSAEQDIGFVNGVVDTAALTAFCGAGSGLVVTLYDQSGSGKNLTQPAAANQPRIYSSGIVVTLKGKPSMFFDGSGMTMGSGLNTIAVNKSYMSLLAVTARSSDIASEVLVFYVRNGAGSTRALLSHRLAASGNTGAALGGRRLDSDSFAVSGSGSWSANAILAGGIFKWAEAKLHYYLNGVLAAQNNAFQTAGSTSNTAGDFSIGANLNGASYLNGHISELIVYESDQTANMANIQANINGHYGIY